jgi:hypothetical protein
MDTQFLDGVTCEGYILNLCLYKEFKKAQEVFNEHLFLFTGSQYNYLFNMLDKQF